MKKLISSTVVVVCIGAIVAGNIHWNNKLSAQGEKLRALEEPVEPVMSKETVEPETVTVEEHQAEVDKEAENKPKEEPEKDLSTYTRNLPETLQNKILAASDSGQPLNMVIYGSDRTSSEKAAWPALLANQLMSVYGEDVIKVTVISEVGKTSLDVNRDGSYRKVSELKPDIVLFEPFVLTDNTGKIAMRNRIGNIEKMIGSWKQANKDVTVFLQPSNPLYGAIYYPQQVAQIQEFAAEHNIPYLNHWENWPDSKDRKLRDYLSDSSVPNESGHKVWAEYLIHYFIAN